MPPPFPPAPRAAAADRPWPCSCAPKAVLRRPLRATYDCGMGDVSGWVTALSTFFAAVAAIASATSTRRQADTTERMRQDHSEVIRAMQEDHRLQREAIESSRRALSSHAVMEVRAEIAKAHTALASDFPRFLPNAEQHLASSAITVRTVHDPTVRSWALRLRCVVKEAIALMPDWADAAEHRDRLRDALLEAARQASLALEAYLRDEPVPPCVLPVHEAAHQWLRTAAAEERHDDALVATSETIDLTIMTKPAIDAADRPV